MKEYDKKRGKANYIFQSISILSMQRKIKVNHEQIHINKHI